ncbi:MAG: hypothetical protein P1U86_12810 [Verrucomicrobiales bacterium]|nr:hypothetical protein [Verrucomicrobiales bacterium]
MGHGIAIITQKAKQGAKIALLLVLAVLVSGVLPLLVQGYAWIDMARKAGGIQMIGEVVANAEPCKICCAAQELRENSREGDEAPLPVERLELLKSLIMDKSAIDLLAEEVGKDSEVNWLRTLRAQRPSSCEFAPATPPPRAFAA